MMSIEYRIIRFVYSVSWGNSMPLNSNLIYIYFDRINYKWFTEHNDLSIVRVKVKTGTVKEQKVV